MSNTKEQLAKQFLREVYAAIHTARMKCVNFMFICKSMRTTPVELNNYMETGTYFEDHVLIPLKRQHQIVPFKFQAIADMLQPDYDPHQDYYFAYEKDVPQAIEELHRIYRDMDRAYNDVKGTTKKASKELN